MRTAMVHTLGRTLFLLSLLFADVALAQVQASAPVATDYRLRRNHGRKKFYVMMGPGGTPATQQLGNSAGTLTCASGTDTDAQPLAAKHYEQCICAAAANATAGWVLTTGTTQRSSNPIFAFSIVTHAALTNRAYWMGLSNASGTTITLTPAIGTIAGVTHAVTVFAFLSTASANWLACVSAGQAGGTMTCTDTGTAVAVTTEYEMGVRIVGADVTFIINGAVVVTTSTNTPIATAELSQMVQSRTTNSSAVGFSLSWIELETG